MKVYKDPAIIRRERTDGQRPLTIKQGRYLRLLGYPVENIPQLSSKEASSIITELLLEQQTDPAP